MSLLPREGGRCVTACAPCLLCRPTQFPTTCHPCSPLGTPATVKHDAGEQTPPQEPWQCRHSEAGRWAASGYILSKIARGYTLQSQFIFKRALCYPMVCLFFLYNRTTFENYISCNDLILLIAIQEKKFPPSQQPSRENFIKSLLEASSTRPLP